MIIKTNPFTVVFTNEMYTSISVSLVKKEDELKLARLFELFLLEHDISFVSTEKQGLEATGRDRTYSLKRIPGKLNLDISAINVAMDEVKKDITIAEAEELLHAPINDGVLKP
jgi:hypothetical protein